MSTNIDELVATARVEPLPAPSATGRGRPPLYLPLLQRVFDAAGQSVRFGPLANKQDAERIRTGMGAYAADHPELLPPGFQGVRFSVRAGEGGWVVYGWCEAK